MSHQPSTKEVGSWSNSSGVTEEDNPACQSCRKRKLKCSRETPSCSQCSRLDTPCVYASARQKPGMKSGAIEALNRRLQVLEDILLQNGGETSKVPPTQVETQHSLYHVSLLLSKELQRIGSHPCSNQINGEPALESLDGSHPAPPRKRKRSDLGDAPPNGNSSILDEDSLASSLPPQRILDKIVDRYFQTLQHWIPFLHPSRTKRMMTSHEEKERLAVVLHAMVYAAAKFLDGDDLAMTNTESQRRHSRQVVLLEAMSCPSITNLQALIIIAFDHIGSGEVAKAWSLVGSLTRTVEYLRLTVEPEELQKLPLRRPLTLLDDPVDWTEIEERRRLFWNIFLLDRFCSITTGWSTSLTSDDVHRRLPCDGGLWHREEISDTPYFGIWNRSAAKIGNSIAFIPAHYPTSDHETDHENTRSPGVMSGSTVVDTSKLGAFAYCIEATESLNQVTTFFLQQKVNFANRQEVGSWLTRFKELDLRLVHWKMFLPQKWKDSNISRDVSLVDMDPNLTLAHLTHNTSMILLHQHIAYPSPNWSELVKLPSSCSAETCQMAAVETLSICQKYLKYTRIGIVNSQFALCAFVAGRILLVHWRFYGTNLLSEFFSLVQCLNEMSRRWRGFPADCELQSPKEQVDSAIPDLAAQYAAQLESFHESFSQNPRYCMDVLGYSRNSSTSGVDSLLPFLGLNQSSPKVPSHFSPARSDPQIRWQSVSASNCIHNNGEIEPSDSRSPFESRSSNGMPRNSDEVRGPDQASVNPWASLPSYQPMTGDLPSTTRLRNGSQTNGGYDAESVEDELTVMSNLLLGQQFLEMDRVITFDGTNFAMDMNNWQSMQ